MSRIVSAERLTAAVAQACARMGARAEDARRVATLLVRSDLAGYASHGVFRLAQYHEWWRKGLLRPDARPAVAAETAYAAQVDGRQAFGQVAATFATGVAIEKVRRSSIGVVTLRGSNHIGRLADYSDDIRSAGFIGLCMANDAGAGQVVAPHGGMDGRLSTNPISVAIPGGPGGGILFDFSTAAAAHGKIRQLLLRNESVPPGWLLDASGAPTQDPAAAFGEPPGAILPAAGPRGFALSLTVEVLAGILSGAGWAGPDPGPEEMNGVFILALDVAPFVAPDEFRRRVDALTAHVKTARPAPGSEGVRIPGARSREEMERRRRAGLPLPDSTWAKLEGVFRELGMEGAMEAVRDA
ncbi:MAG: Ldh family oxidoreductase [Candidatus Methylomirabilales bacterium]